ncbi:ERO1-like protein alpha isoform X1 [Tachypleus tridentatus]|uniref:ERO1-like protein alpha isoform X1 n=1 Tax=Tachypleus tridentatus TaxID=6853 RepID=UPI003FD4284D
MRQFAKSFNIVFYVGLYSLYLNICPRSLVSGFGSTESVLPAEKCFCKLEGQIDDCECSVNTVDYFNNLKIYPRLNSLLLKNFFRFYKVNLERVCPFWPDFKRCATEHCSVETCSEEHVPAWLSTETKNSNGKFAHKYLKEAQNEEDCDDNHAGLGAVDDTLSEDTKEKFEKWQKYDESQENFCETENESSTDVRYVDLHRNPERFTGYKGVSSHNVWRSIYQENCFKPDHKLGPFTATKNLGELCLEKRIFFRAISGLHTSITVHLCAEYYTPSKTGFGSGNWGPNVPEFLKRFSTDKTDGEGPDRLKNLYFVYLLELRALAKAALYLESQSFYTGDDAEDGEVISAVMELLSIIKSFPNHFKESVLFPGKDEETAKLKEEFRQHFINITRIMDCVGCDKCRLWGKLQTEGLGTAMKILFSGKLDSDLSMPQLNKNSFHLTRNEIVTLFNAFGRLSTSVYQLENFRKLIKS